MTTKTKPQISKVYTLLTNNERVSLDRISRLVANPTAAISYLRKNDGLEIVAERSGNKTYYRVIR